MEATENGALRSELQRGPPSGLSEAWTAPNSPHSCPFRGLPAVGELRRAAKAVPCAPPPGSLNEDQSAMAVHRPRSGGTPALTSVAFVRYPKMGLRWPRSSLFTGPATPPGAGKHFTGWFQARAYKVAAPDLPRHGHFDRRGIRFIPLRAHVDVASAANGLEPPLILVGHSLEGAVFKTTPTVSKTLESGGKLSGNFLKSLGFSQNRSARSRGRGPRSRWGGGRRPEG